MAIGDIADHTLSKSLLTPLTAVGAPKQADGQPGRFKITNDKGAFKIKVYDFPGKENVAQEE